MLGCSKKFLQTDVRYCLLKWFFFCNSSCPWAKPHPYSFIWFSHWRPLSQNLQSSVLTFFFHAPSLVFYLLRGLLSSMLHAFECLIDWHLLIFFEHTEGTNSAILSKHRSSVSELQKLFADDPAVDLVLGVPWSTACWHWVSLRSSIGIYSFSKHFPDILGGAVKFLILSDGTLTWTRTL